MNSRYAFTGVKQIHDFLLSELGYKDLIIFSQHDRYQIYAALMESDGLQKRVVARAIVLSYKGRSVSKYEELSEGHPDISFCPAKILNILSTTTNVNLLRWRTRCRAYNYHAVSEKARKIEESLKTGGRGSYRLKSLQYRMLRERAALDQSLLILSLFDFKTIKTADGQKINCNYFVKHSACKSTNSRYHVVFEGLANKRAAFYIPEYNYFSLPEASYPTVADFAQKAVLVPAPLHETEVVIIDN
jgi:hypothetical protein